MLIKVYRIENPLDGLGCFNSKLRESHSNYPNIKRRHQNFPNPYEELEIYNFFEFDSFCAYNSLNQIRELFSKEELVEYIQIGFNIIEIKLEIYYQSKNQTIYKKKDILNSTVINNLFK